MLKFRLMTAIAGWIGRERPISLLTDAFLRAEEIDRSDGNNIIRKADGSTSVSVVVFENDSSRHSYTYIDGKDSIKQWEKNTVNILNTNFAMGSVTRGFPRSPATTLRKIDGHELIISYCGYATELADLLKLDQSQKGDTDVISDWVINRGIELLPETLGEIAETEKSMHMVIALSDHENADIYLLRSKEHPRRINGTPKLHYVKNENDIVYGSLPEEAVIIQKSYFNPVEENTIYRFGVKLK